MSAPAISVIMPCYNGATLIEETIACVLRQTVSDFELIVVDDCSTDTTRDVLGRIGDPRLRVLSTPHNMGPVGARNLACQHATGRFIAALDHDDLCHETRFARQIAFLDASPNVVATGTAAQVLTGTRLRPDGYPPRTTPIFMRWMLHVLNPLVWSSMMIRGEAASALDPFSRPKYLFAEDFDLYHRLALLGDIARIDDPLTTYRSHAGGASKRHRPQMRSSARGVLAEAYRPWFGAEADTRANLMITYLAGRDLVPDLPTLDAIGNNLADLRDKFQEHHIPDAESTALIAHEMSRQWWLAAASGIRAGRLRLRDVRAMRPEFASRSDFPVRTHISAGVIGWFRSLSLGESKAGWDEAIPPRPPS